MTDYLIVGFLDDTETSRLIAGDTPIVVMTPEGLGTLAAPNVNASYVVQFSRLCNIPDTINELKANNNLSDEQIIGNIPLLSIQGQIEGETGVSEMNTCSIGKEQLEQIKQNDIVKRAYGRMFAYDVPAENSGQSYNANLISYEENQFEWAADSLVDGSIETVMQQENQVLFVQTENADVQVGDNIVLTINDKSQTVTVAGILSDSPLAREEGTETFFCSEETFTALTGEIGYTIIDIQFKNNASSEDVKTIENIFSNGGVIFSDNLSRVQQQRNLYHTFAVLVYGFLSIIVAITIFHIMNTINMGVAAKMKEYGGMRAIGMSNRQLVRMIIAEAGTYAINGVIWGCIIGLPMHWVVYVSLITNIWGTTWSIPFIPLILIIAIVLLTSLLAVREPAKRLQRMSIVENINAQ